MSFSMESMSEKGKRARPEDDRNKSQFAQKYKESKMSDEDIFVCEIVVGACSRGINDETGFYMKLGPNEKIPDGAKGWYIPSGETIFDKRFAAIEDELKKQREELRKQEEKQREELRKQEEEFTHQIKVQEDEIKNLKKSLALSDSKLNETSKTLEKQIPVLNRLRLKDAKNQVSHRFYK